jgi:hypothetical protein
MINIYEPDEDGVEQLVYREMNDEEFTEWKARVAAYEAQLQAEQNRPHPLIEQVQSMTEVERKQLRDLLADL